MSLGIVIKATATAEVEQLQIMTGMPGTTYAKWIYFSGSEATLRTELLEEPEIQRDTIILETTYDEEGVVTEPEFNFVTKTPQQMDSNFFLKVMRENPDEFPVTPEPEPEPRYKTVMTSSEFIRDVLTKLEVATIGSLQATDPSVWAWAYITSAGHVSVDHPDFAPGIQLGIDKGVWNTERANEISKGLLIQ